MRDAAINLQALPEQRDLIDRAAHVQPGARTADGGEAPLGQGMSATFSAPQPLTAAHRLDDFSCGEPALDDWLKRRAMANQQSGASCTFVVVDQDDRVQGYYARWPRGRSHTVWLPARFAATCQTPFRS